MPLLRARSVSRHKDMKIFPRRDLSSPCHECPVPCLEAQLPDICVNVIMGSGEEKKDRSEYTFLVKGDRRRMHALVHSSPRISSFLFLIGIQKSHRIL